MERIGVFYFWKQKVKRILRSNPKTKTNKTLRASRSPLNNINNLFGFIKLFFTRILFLIIIIYREDHEERRTTQQHNTKTNKQQNFSLLFLSPLLLLSSSFFVFLLFAQNNIVILVCGIKNCKLALVFILSF